MTQESISHDSGRWEQRWHPLRREWVIVAAHRQDRPWLGAVHEHADSRVVKHDPTCHFCPGNTRISGAVNPDYRSVFVFDNDHPCVAPDAPVDLEQPTRPYANRRADGVARVVCYHPRHDFALGLLSHAEMVGLLHCWQQQYAELGERSEVNHVLVFENRGAVVGVSNHHPHGQIYATNFVFKTIENEAVFARDHYEKTGRSLLGDMVDAEIEDGSRIVCQADTAVAFVPYCARWAYETYVAPRRACASLVDLSDDEIDDFAVVLREMVIRYDNLWTMPFPYILVLHNAPTDGREYPGFHFHVEFHTPLRKPNLVKHLAGPESGGGSFLSDTWPEAKAAELQATSNIHYLDAER